MIDQHFPQPADLVTLVDDLAITADGPSGTVPPAHRIPPEIVAKIIHELLPAKVDYEPGIRKRLEALSVATSICRYWRFAALDHAFLWSVVPMDCKNLAELYLQRSRNAPLFITLEEDQRRRPVHQAMVSLLPHMQRVKKVQFHAPVPVLNEIFSTLNRFVSGAQLEEINIRVDGFPGDEKCGAVLDLLLKHAQTTRVLRLTDFKNRFPPQDHRFPHPRFPTHQLREFFQLSHLELLPLNDVRDVSFLFTSLPALTSIKIRVTALETHGDDRRPKDRIVPQANLRKIHLQIVCSPPSRVLGALKIPTGVHLECEIFGPYPTNTNEQILPLHLPSEFFENASHIEELQIAPPLCFGSGPNGSFSIDEAPVAGLQPPIDDFSHLRKLVVGRRIKQRSLEDLVGLAPQLVSVVFVDCIVIKSREIGPPSKKSHSLADFVKAISDERRVGSNVEDGSAIVVNGTLEGEHLKEFRSLFGRCN